MVSADLHIHSALSFDGEAPMRSMCEAALAKGVTTVAFAEHHDADMPRHHLDIPAYLAAIDEARAAFPGMTILRSVEAGHARGYGPQLREAVGAIDPDFLLLSCHSVDGVDPYHAAAYHARRTRAEGQRAYLEALLTAMEELPDFDALAHIGYAARYAPPGEAATPLICADAPDLIDEVLRRLIDGGRALEVNTSQTASGGAPIPGEDILRRYFALGGRRVTLGSDAHRPDAVASGFADAAAMLRRVGFTEYAVYRRRERVAFPL